LLAGTSSLNKSIGLRTVSELSNGSGKPAKEKASQNLRPDWPTTRRNNHLDRDRFVGAFGDAIELCGVRVRDGKSDLKADFSFTFADMTVRLDANNLVAECAVAVDVALDLSGSRSRVDAGG